MVHRQLKTSAQIKPNAELDSNMKEPQTGAKVIAADAHRSIEYSVHGSLRPDAQLFVTAYISEHWTWPEPWHKSYLSMNIKSISISIPGVGRSTPHPGQSILDWPTTDLARVFDAEGISRHQGFVIWGSSHGCLYAMAVAQRMGSRVLALGLRAPYLPLSASIPAGLPEAQGNFPTTQELESNAWNAAFFRFAINSTMMNPQLRNPEPESAAHYLMERGYMGPGAQAWLKFIQDYPLEAESMMGKISSSDCPVGRPITTEGLLYMMAKNVALECPGLDVSKIRDSIHGNQVVIWYAADDPDCPPSHGSWLSEYLLSKWTRVFKGHGHFSAALVDMHTFFCRLQDSISVGLDDLKTEVETEQECDGANPTFQLESDMTNDNERSKCRGPETRKGGERIKPKNQQESEGTKTKNQKGNDTVKESGRIKTKLPKDNETKKESERSQLKMSKENDTKKESERTRPRPQQESETKTKRESETNKESERSKPKVQQTSEAKTQKESERTKPKLLQESATKREKEGTKAKAIETITEIERPKPKFQQEIEAQKESERTKLKFQLEIDAQKENERTNKLLKLQQEVEAQNPKVHQNVARTPKESERTAGKYQRNVETYKRG
jgi:pimeloyl-ACP methyl ester carboxylesterase